MDRFNFFQSRSPYAYDLDRERERERGRAFERENRLGPSQSHSRSRPSSARNSPDKSGSPYARHGEYERDDYTHARSSSGNGFGVVSERGSERDGLYRSHGPATINGASDIERNKHSEPKGKSRLKHPSVLTPKSARKSSPHGSQVGHSPLARTQDADKDKDGDEGDGEKPQRSRKGCLCVWPDPETKGNKKRRSSLSLDRPSRNGPHRSSSRATSTKIEPVEHVDRTDTYLPPGSGSGGAMPSVSTLQAQVHIEPNPLASLLGAAHASAMQDQQRYPLHERSGSTSLSYLDNLSSLTGISPAYLSASLQQQREIQRNGTSTSKGKRRDSSPVPDLRPTGSASLAQILDTHESLNAVEEDTGTERDLGQGHAQGGGSANGLDMGRGLEHAIYQHQRQQGEVRLHPPQVPPQDGRNGKSTSAARFKDHNGSDLGIMLDSAGKRVESGGHSNGHGNGYGLKRVRSGTGPAASAEADIRMDRPFGQPTTVQPMALHQHHRSSDLPHLDPRYYSHNMPQTQFQTGFGGNDVNGLDGAGEHPIGRGVGEMSLASRGVSGHETGPSGNTSQMGNDYHHTQLKGVNSNQMDTVHPGANGTNGLDSIANFDTTTHPNDNTGNIGTNHNSNPNPINNDPSTILMLDNLETDWFQLLFGNTQDLVSQPPPAFPPLHFQPPPLPPPTRFYVPPDFLPRHSLHDSDDSHGGEFTRVLVRDDKRAEMMADPAFLAPYFPNLDERIVMRHYLRNTVNIIIAFQCPRKPWNPWVTLHAPLAFNHMPGVNPAADALRAAMLAVGAVHLRFTHNSADQKGAWAIVRASKAKVLALVRRSIDAQQANNTPMDKGDVEMILAALLSCTIASSLAADESWHELLTSVVSLVGKLGGAHALLHDGRHTYSDINPITGTEVKQMSALRFLLEQLAIRDVFGCMTTELPPNMLNEAFSPWFFEAESWSKGDDEWESIERMFGISRGMVDVIARACTLISQVRKNGITVSEDLSAESGWGTHTKDFTLRLPQRVINRLDDARGDQGGGGKAGGRGKRGTVAISPHAIVIPTPPATSSPSMSITTGLTPRAEHTADIIKSPTRHHHISGGHAGSSHAETDQTKRGISPTTAILQADVLHAANNLIAELSVWDKSSNFTPLHPRTQYGNHAYRHAIRIRLLREVFMVPMEDKRVQDSVGSIVELTVELLAQYGRITWLTWPIVLAAFNMLPKDPQRQVALTLLNEFTYHACFDLIAARKMLCEFWEEEDMATTPGQVVKRQRVRPFLD